MNLAKLQKEAHAIARDHGWWDTERTFGDCIALVHSELSEALEAYRVHGLEDQTYEANDWESMRPDDRWPPSITVPEGVASELADVVIRVADIAEWYGVDLTEHVPPPRDYGADAILQGCESFGDWITVLGMFVGFVYWHYKYEQGLNPWAWAAGQLVYGVQRVAAHYDIDLDAAIAAKLEYMRSTARC